MRRTIALAATLLLIVVCSIPVGAQEPSPTPADDPTITTAGLGDIPELPAGAAFLRLLRVTIQPGGALPWNVGHQQATAGAVHEGEVAIHFELDALHEPFNGDPIVVAAGSVVNAASPDGFFAGKGTTFTILNVSTAPAVVLLGSIEPEGWVPAQSASRFINSALVQSDLLGVGILRQLPAAPATLVLARAIYEPGQGDTEANPSGGPTVAYVESGEFSYLLDSGTVELTTTASSATPVATQTLTPGSTTTLHRGDAVFEQDAVTLVRNDSTEQAIAIVCVLVPTAT